MLLVKAGDLETMSLLFERHHQTLFGFLFHLTQRREASEDMVQTVFYRMLKYRSSFTAASSLGCDRDEFMIIFMSYLFNVLYKKMQRAK